MGVGFGLAFAAMSSLIVSAVPAAQTGVASGMNANIRTIGGSHRRGADGQHRHLAPGADGLPNESGYTDRLRDAGRRLLLAALAALLIPSVKRAVGAVGAVGVSSEDEPEHVELAIVAGGTLIGDKSE